MSESKHTPGPWITSESSHRIEWSHWIMTGGDRDAMIAAAAEIPQAPGISDANARLIAAAPELLDVVQRLIAYNAHYSVATYQEWDGMIRDAKNAIAKGVQPEVAS